jgi:hypothetical protein
MTTGTIDRDDRTYVEQTHNGLGTGNYILTGTKFSKSWTGGDAGPNENPLLEHPYAMSLVDIYDGIKTVKILNFAHETINEYTQAVGALLVPLGSPTGLWTSNDDLKLLEKAANKIRGSDLNVGNIIAECGQTTALFAQTATRIARMLHFIKNGNVYEAARSVTAKGKTISATRKVFTKGLDRGDAASAILELQYGWRPLLKDVDSAVEGLANRIVRGIKQYTKVTRRLKSTSTTNIGGLNWALQHEILVQFRITHATPTLGAILNLNNPIAALHEVTPFSFVGDWFIPINSYLQALNFQRDFGVTSLWKTTKTVASARPLGSSSEFTIFDGTDGSYKKAVSVVRVPESFTTIANVPVPVFKDLSKALSPEHLLNAGALLMASANRFSKVVKF